MRDKGAALVSAASGIGDIIRVTPLVRTLRRLDYEVDMLLSPDDATAADLFRGSPELRDLFVLARNVRLTDNSVVAALRQRRYQIATFTTLSAPLGRWVNAEQRYRFDATWRTGGDSACIERLARAIGWHESMPAPFVMKSQRHFGLPSGTVALHPGCKPTWPWKKWHGFGEVAALLDHVVVIGMPCDLDNSRTYFRRAFEWPKHISNFVGKLDLADTAALVSQCAALISLDSGMMHLGVALGVPTFGIFGITRPERECIPSPHMTPIAKRIACEPDCHRGPWGRRDCSQHLACLKSLTADEVVAYVAAGI